MWKTCGNCQMRVKEDRAEKGKRMERESVKDRFLQECKDKRTEMNFIMRTGFQHHGFLIEYGDGVIIAEVNGVNKLLYQAAISTIEPYIQHYAPRQAYVRAAWGGGTGRSSERRFLDT